MQNKHVVGDKHDGVDDGVDNGVDNSVDDSVDDNVDNSDDGADKHLTHLSQVVDCCLMKRSKQNKHVVGNKDNGVDGADDDSVDNGVDNSNDGADKQLIHLSQGVDCHLTQRSDPNRCVNDGKEGIDNSDDDSVDNSDDGGDMHLAHFTQVEHNVNLGVCDKHLTHVVKNTPESPRSDVTGHVTHVRIFWKNANF
jgi:hypothetical protein